MNDLQIHNIIQNQHKSRTWKKTLHRAPQGPRAPLPHRRFAADQTWVTVGLTNAMVLWHAQQEVTEGNVQGSEKNFGEETVRSTMYPDGQMNTRLNSNNLKRPFWACTWRRTH